MRGSCALSQQYVQNTAQVSVSPRSSHLRMRQCIYMATFASADAFHFKFFTAALLFLRSYSLNKIHMHKEQPEARIYSVWRAPRQKELYRVFCSGAFRMSYGCLLKFKLCNVSRWQFGLRAKNSQPPGVEGYLLRNNGPVCA